MIDCRERKLGVKNGLFDFVFGSFLFPASSLEIDLTEVKKSRKGGRVVSREKINQSFAKVHYKISYQKS